MNKLNYIGKNTHTRIKLSLLISFILIIILLFFTELFSQNFPINIDNLFKSEAETVTPLQSSLDLQQTLRNIAEKRSQATVNVGALIELEPEVAEYYGLPIENDVSGSGFIISTEGYIITNYHVIEGAKKITITLHNGRQFGAGIVGYDDKTDIALLQINPQGEELPTMPLGDSDNLKVGDIVVAIGNPWGLSGSITMGIVSAMGRTDQMIEETAILKNYIQTDVAINQGNSGGPLLNLNGEVVAINSALLSAGGGWDGISFSIPIKIVKRIVKDLADDGKVERGYLGVSFKALDKDLADYFDLEMNEGVLIVEVIKDSPAEKGGIQEGDVILEFNGEPINTLDELANQVLATTINEEVPVIVLRDGEKIELMIKIEKRPDDFGETKNKVEVNKDGTVNWMGMELGNYEQFSENIVFDGDGLVVVSVAEGSFAEKKGIKPGDIIISINDEPINDILQLEKYMDTEDNLFMLKVYRNGKFDIIVLRG